jgi:hypothetical protein
MALVRVNTWTPKGWFRLEFGDLIWSVASFLQYSKDSLGFFASAFASGFQYVLKWLTAAGL